MPGYIRRFFICDGDKTTAGGTVIGSATRHKLKSVPRAVEGDRVVCPACNSVGVIKCITPISIMTLDTRQQAAEGDLCMCGCNPPPRLVAGLAREFGSLDFYPEDIAASPLAMQWYVSVGHDLAVLGHQSNQRFLVVDKETGEALSNMPYQLECDGQTIEGTTGADGMTESVHSLKKEMPIKVHLRTQA